MCGLTLFTKNPTHSLMPNNTTASVSPPITARVTYLLCLTAALGLSGCALELADVDKNELSTVTEKEQSIVGGVSTTIAQHPWQVSLQFGSSHFCGGSIIAADWVLTAQHCIDGTSAGSLTVEAGATRLSDTGQRVGVAEIIRFPGYTDPSNGRDVALLRLASPFTFNSNVAPIRTATAADAAAGLTNGGVTATVTGWGTLQSGGSSPNTLQEVDVPLVSQSQVQAAYSQEIITSDQLGAGILGVGGKDACQGDSGGPLTVFDGSQNVLVGVVSWGYGCADPQFPGLYARVSSFESFIADNVSAVSVPVLSQSGLSDSQGGWQHFQVTVPAGASSFSAVMSGGTGDADLYVRFGSQPTTNQYDCRPYLNGNNESCSFNSPPAGTWFVSVNAFSSYSGVNLSAAYRGDPPDDVCGDGVCSAAEDCGSCSADCGQCAPTCGDGVCNGSEDCGSCANDCGQCAPTCGDGVCNGSEDCGSCANDCGQCVEPGEIASEDFESQTLNGGTGWSGPWTASGDLAWGAGGVRLRRSTGDLQRTAPTGGLGNLTLSFWSGVVSFEGNDEALIQISTNGGASWSTVAVFDSSDSDATWHANTVDISQFDGAANITVRINAEMSSSQDAFYIDNIVLEGS